MRWGWVEWEERRNERRRTAVSAHWGAVTVVPAANYSCCRRFGWQVTAHVIWPSIWPWIQPDLIVSLHSVSQRTEGRWFRVWAVSVLLFIVVRCWRSCTRWIQGWCLRESPPSSRRLCLAINDESKLKTLGQLAHFISPRKPDWRPEGGTLTSRSRKYLSCAFIAYLWVSVLQAGWHVNKQSLTLTFTAAVPEWLHSMFLDCGTKLENLREAAGTENSQ